MAIKEQIENELNRRVREALDTPPMERWKRNQKEALLRKSSQETNKKKNLNSHIKFDSKERYKFRANLLNSTKCSENEQLEKKFENLNNSSSNEENISIEYNKFEYWLKPQVQPSQLTSAGVLQKLDENNAINSLESKTLRTGFEAVQNFGSLTLEEKEIFFSTFTKQGFREAMRTGKLPDGSKLEALANGEFRDKFGIVRSKDGPFWPKDIGPLFPAPHHKIFQSSYEPLFDPLKDKETSKQAPPHGSHPAGWKHMQIVYDSETYSRNQRPHQHSECESSSLIFESRFETGNLRQSRRTGQYEYELLLNNDLYTKRHTQWFYFRLQNMEKNVTYKFIIINLLKSKSLYEEGMRILMYSDKNATTNSIGWYRTGHHIRYTRNFTRLQCPLLNREMAYFQLEFQIEFLYSEDTCYLSHCYPYTFTDLKNDLRTFESNCNTKPLLKKDILCETNIGNSCFLLTITDKSIPEKEKLGAVITARVHPGETNSSWMMKGLIQYLIGNSETAKTLRRRIVFKIVPMLNPDGVIVGNYRCSTVGKDLNRNYRNPKEERFPTIFHTKRLIEDFKKSCTAMALYCDLHGHSRKHNVFMYGCDSQYLHSENFNDINPVLNINTIEDYIKDRIFTFLMQKNGPETFSFNGCHFKIRKCKESTGRVVMWKQFNVNDSYTLEATFSGTDINDRRHFNINDLENIGKIFSESLFSYISIMKDEQQQKEIGLDLLKAILKQIVSKSKAMNQLFRKLVSQTTDHIGSEVSLTNNIPKVIPSDLLENINELKDNSLDLFIDNLKMDDIKQLKEINFDVSDIEDSSSSDSDSDSQPGEEIIENEQKISAKVKKRKKKSKIQIKELSTKKPLLKKLSSKILPSINKGESSSPANEMKNTEKGSIKTEGNQVTSELAKSSREKHNINTPFRLSREMTRINVPSGSTESNIVNSIRQKNNMSSRNLLKSSRSLYTKKLQNTENSLKCEGNKSYVDISGGFEQTDLLEVNSNLKLLTKSSPLRQWPIFLSKFDGRTNGGIPCFTEERVLERARRKSLTSIRKDIEESLFKIPFEYTNEYLDRKLNAENRLSSIMQTSELLNEQYCKLQKNSDEILLYRLYKSDTSEEYSENNKERILPKPVYNTNNLKDIQKSSVKQHILVKNEESQAFKSLTLDSPTLPTKEIFLTKKIGK